MQHITNFLLVSELLSFPPDLVQEAKRVVLFLRERVERSKQSAMRDRVSNQLFYEVVEQLLFLKYTEMPLSAVKESVAQGWTENGDAVDVFHSSP